jgi:hypothetical protein
MNPYANVQPFDGNAIAQRFQQGRQMRQERDTRNALMDYMQAEMGNGIVAGDQTTQQADEAIRAVMRANPQMGMQLLQQRRQKQAQTQQQQIEIVGRVAAWADTPEKWDQGIDHLAMEGVPGVEKYKGKFSPGLRAAVMAKAGVGDKSQQPTEMQRNYEFLQGQDPQLAQSYLKNQAEGAPLIASNGDGTFTIIPRGMAQGQQQASAPPPPPPGFVLDNGGQSGAPAGNFP